MGNCPICRKGDIMEYLITGIIQDKQGKPHLYSEVVKFDEEYVGPTAIGKLYDKAYDIAEKHLQNLPSENFGGIRFMDVITVWRKNIYNRWIVIEKQ